MSGDRGDRLKRDPVLVVGIGASAGGLDACKRFLSAMPPDSGMAFVIVMHLDPSHESRLAELFQAATTMQVVQVKEACSLEPDHAYVIAPDSALEIRDGILNPKKPNDPHGRRKPVDALFSSLARDQHERAVAIVLSGTGNNGSSGIQAVKSEGGLCLVQDPESAEYDGMPRNAIATGAPDRVLLPAEMPAVLLEYAKDPGALGGDDGEEPEAEVPETLEGILTLLGQTYGVNFRTGYKPGTLARRTERRMALKRISDFGEYLEVLRKDPKEVAALYRDVLIDVTRFFRDPEVWEQLASEVVPNLLAQRDSGLPLKIWVAGCATGEEAYSLTMLFLEQMDRRDDRRKLQVFASDVAEDALAFARRGLYPQRIRDDVSPKRLERFFHAEGEGFEINREVRECVTFAVHNLLADPPFSRLDMVSCRNVLIYLEAQAQQRIFEVFNFALKPGGVLLLGASETVGRHTDLFEPVSQKARIYQSTATTEAARRQHLGWTAARASLRGMAGGQPPPPRGPRVSRAIEQMVLSRYTQACVAVTESFEIRSFFGPTERYLAQPTGEARMDLLAWAKPGLYSRLRSGLDQAREKNESVHLDDLRMERDGANQRVACTIEPVAPLAGEARLFLVSFRDVPQPPLGAGPDAEATASEEPASRQLEAELKRTRAELKSTIEQLESTDEGYRASHEELLSLNEELQSNNEELEASKEELQSLNEEMVTINRQLEEKNLELRTAYDDLNNIVVSTRIPIVFLSRDLRIRRFTPAATELLSLTPADIGRSIEDVKEHYTNGTVKAESQSVLDGLTPVITEVGTSDGRWFSRTIAPYRTEDDRIDGVCIAFHDVTDRKKAALEIDEARIYAESVVRAVPTPLIILNSDLRVVSANRAFYEKFRVSPQVTEGVLLYELGNRQWDIPKLRELLERVLPEKRDVQSFEVEHSFEDLGSRTMRLNAHLMSRQDRPDLILLGIEDTTDLKTAARVTEGRAQELLQEHRRKDEFLSMLGHELRNPLSALMHGLDLLDLAPDDRQRVEQVRGMMRRQSKRIASMLDQLLDIARLNSGKIQMARSAVNLQEAVEAAVEAVKPLIESRRHELSVSLPDAAVLVQGDLARLTQVVENLLTNAAKYTEEGGRIELSLEGEPQWARLRLRDSGVGMEPDLLPHIFELFSQATRTLERSAGGLGLGLPLVKRVVEMHGGTVTASSAGPGQGSEFVVKLPRLRERRSAEREGGNRKAKDDAVRRVLVVDDEVDSATMLATILGMRGHQTQVAHDGEAALEAARAFEPDVVLLDLGLPKMNGYEVARRIRDASDGRRVLLVALTGYEADPERLEHAGFDRHLIKPPDMDTLTKLLGTVASPER